MEHRIKFIDNGAKRYLIDTDSFVLGRLYEDKADSIVVEYPEYEIENESLCTMIVTADGTPIDHIDFANGQSKEIRNNLTQYPSIEIGFIFSKIDGYSKASEVRTFRFLDAPKPDNFEPIPPEQRADIDTLINFGFTNAYRDDDELVFENPSGAVVKRVHIESGGGGGGSGAIDVIKVQGVTQQIVNKTVDLGVATKTEFDTLNSTVETNTSNISYLEQNKADVEDLPDVSQFVKNSELSMVATTGDYNDLNGKPNIPTKTTDLLNDSGFVTLSSIPTKTSDLTNDSNFITNTANNLTNYELKTNTGATIELSVDPTTYIVTLNLKNSAGTTISTGTIDLPLETMVIGASYLDGTLTLTLKNGQVIDIDISSIISGLVPEDRKVAGIDLKDDITASELKTALGVGTLETQVQTNTTDIASLQTTKANTSDIPTSTNQLTNNSGFITASDIPSIPTKTSQLQNDSNFVTLSAIPTNTSQLNNDSGFTTTTYVDGAISSAIASAITTALNTPV